MSKKDFIRLADYIRNAGNFTENQIEHLARFCYEQNSRFNRERWIAYIKGECGPNGGAIKK